MRVSRVRFTLWWAAALCLVAGASVRFEAWEYRTGATTSRYSSLLLPWQRVPNAPAGTKHVEIRKRSLFGLQRFDYKGPLGLFPGTGGHE